MIESAQTTLRGIKENFQSSKVSKQRWGHEEKNQRVQKIELLIKITDMMMLNQVKKKKEKQRERSQAQHWGAR
jgi:hypothetical protein